MASKKISQIDSRTGEVLTDGFVAYIAPKRKNAFGKGWAAMSQEAMKELAKRRKQIAGEGYAVMLSIMGDAAFNNEFKAVNQSKIAEDLDMHKSHVSRAVKRLLSLDILEEGPREGVNRSYRIHPEIMWKGAANAHIIAMSDFQNGKGRHE